MSTTSSTSPRIPSTILITPQFPHETLAVMLSLLIWILMLRLPHAGHSKTAGNVGRTLLGVFFLRFRPIDDSSL